MKFLKQLKLFGQSKLSLSSGKAPVLSVEGILTYD